MNASEQKTEPQSACLQRLVRPVFISVPADSDDNSSDALWPDRRYVEKSGWHHGWTQAARCAIGDGSSIYHQTLAIVEMGDGRVEYMVSK